MNENKIRQIEDHKIHANDSLEISVSGDKKSFAHNVYNVSGFNTSTNPDIENSVETSEKENLEIIFQSGPISENGVNGITMEVLLAIVADRLRSFQQSPFVCKENACALTHIEEALHWLQQRTLQRIRRGVEGTMQK